MIGGLPTRFEGWRRGPALAVIALLVAALIAACWQPAGNEAPAPRMRTSATQPSDLQLYRAVVAGVRNGESYYVVAAREQRANHYPLKPFTTFRLPTQAMLYATFGQGPMTALLWVLTGGMMLAWWLRLKPLMPPLHAGAFIVFVAGGIGGIMQPVTGFFHESWAAILLALMIAIYRPGKAWPAMIAGGCALMIRELALPMILVMGGWALIGRRWKEAAGWAAIVGLFAVYLSFHAHWVSQVVLPSDPPSPGWTGLNGLQFALKSIAQVTMGIAMPTMVASAWLILSLFGWLSIRKDWAFLASCLLAGYGLALAVFARVDTFYWALLPAPLAFAGAAFLPIAFADLAKALRRVPEQTP